MNKEELHSIISEDKIRLYSDKDALTAELLFEDIGKRSATTKHFRTRDGNYIAADFQKPIHFLDKASGKYVELEETLKENNNRIESTTPNFTAFFPNNCANDEYVGIKKDGRTFEWRFRDKAKAVFKPAETKSVKKVQIEKPHSPVFRYENYTKEYALEYSLNENGIKESIILMAPAKTNEFVFDTNTTGLRVVQSKDGKTIELFAEDSDNKEPEFILPGITMFDAAGSSSDNAHYEIDFDNGAITAIKIVVANEWLFSNDRVYPIVIDPQVITYNSFGHVYTFITIGSDNTRMVTEGMYVRHLSRVGYKNNGTEYRTFLKLNYPELPHSAAVTSATLKLSQDDYAGSGDYTVRKVTSSWDYSTINWGNQPAAASFAYDTFTGAERTSLNIDLTANAQSYYAGNTSDNYGIVIKASDPAPCICNGNTGCTYSDQFVEFGCYDPPVILVKYIAADEYADHQQ